MRQPHLETPEPPPPKRVLVVDDSRLQRRILAASLTRWGYEVFEAESGEKGLEIARDILPDVILSDWMMPGMNGLDFCQAFRALPRETYGYFILVTSKTEKDAVARALDCGADDFITKPVDPPELRARMHAGDRILKMERELANQNRVIAKTLQKLQSMYDALDSDLQEAKKLQQSLIREKYRDFGPVRVSLTLQSCGHVGGDLVGFYPINDHQIGIFALDVSGHGVSSALMTAKLASYLSTGNPDHNVAIQVNENNELIAVSPDQVALELNRLVLTEMETEHYFTMLLAVINLQTGVIDFVQAGHPHPLIQRRGGSIEQIGAGGMPIGLIAEASYQLSQARLFPGDRIWFCSDGITECADKNDVFLDETGLARLIRPIATTRGQAALETLLWSLSEYADHADFSDDISAVLVEYQGVKAD